MGRVALGAAAKSRTGSVRLTAAEEELLKRKYGSVTKALRVLVNKELEKELNK